MRGLEVIIFLLCIVISIPLVPVLMPTYNSGAGVDTGGADFTGVSAFNWSSIDKYKPAPTDTGLIAIAEQANYYFQLALTALGWIAALLWSAVWSAPGLLSVFMVNPTLSAILLSLLAIILILSWVQIAKNDDWSGRR